MIEARLAKARRLHRIHENLQHMEEERIAGLQRRRAELAAKQEEVVNSLSADGDLQAMFMPMIVRRLKALREEQGRIDEEIERRVRALQGIAARTKYAERLSDTYEQEQTRVREQKELLDVIERTTRPGDASLP